MTKTTNWKGTLGEALKKGIVTQEEVDVWNCDDEIEKAELRGKQEGIKSERERILKIIDKAECSLRGVIQNQGLNDEGRNQFYARINELKNIRLKLKQQISDNHSQQTKQNNSGDILGEKSSLSHMNKTADTRKGKSEGTE
jgi:hypothetical protein